MFCVNLGRGIVFLLGAKIFFYFFLPEIGLKKEDTCYDVEVSLTFRLKTFLSDGAPQPKIVGNSPFFSIFA